MVKKNNQEIKKELTPAYKGSISTVIITVFILGFGWFLPMIIADRLESARRGEGFQDLTPVETIIFDINSDSDLEKSKVWHVSNTHWNAGRYEWQQINNAGYIGTFASPFKSGYQYTNTPINNYWLYNGVMLGETWHDEDRNVVNDLSLTYIDTDFPNKDSTHDNYIVANLNPDIIKLDQGKNQNKLMQHWLESWVGINRGYHDESDERFRNERINFFTNFDLDQWKNGEVTRIKFYWEFFSNLPWVVLRVTAISLQDGAGKTLYSSYKQVTSNPMSFTIEEDITLNDLIDLENLIAGHDRIVLRWEIWGAKANGNSDQRRAHFTPHTDIIFDAQVYGLFTPEAEEKPFLSTMDKFSIYMILQSIGICILGIAMLPQFTMGGIFRKLGLLEKKKD